MTLSDTHLVFSVQHILSDYTCACDLPVVPEAKTLGAEQSENVSTTMLHGIWIIITT